MALWDVDGHGWDGRMDPGGAGYGNERAADSSEGNFKTWKMNPENGKIAHL